MSQPLPSTQPRYKWFRVNLVNDGSGNFVFHNTTDGYAVVVGYNPTSPGNQTITVSSDQAGADPIDLWQINQTASFTAGTPQDVASTFDQVIISSRHVPKMLIPPNYFLHDEANSKVSIVMCRTLDDALAIL